MALSVGQVVGQRYRVEAEVATGGMGAVYRVTRSEDGVALALKVIRKDLVGGDTAMERFRREAQLLAALDHPGVVKFFDAGLTEDGSMFLVMELLEGETLLAYFQREAPVAAVEVAKLVRGMATALDAVHSVGVVHRDLKPGNVFSTPTGVKLVDFGIAKAADVTRLTMTGQVVGTVRYMAPEQLLGNDVDGRADVYAVGVMAWAALAGGPPFIGAGMDAVQEVLAGIPRLEESAPELGDAICEVVHRATSRDPDSRFATAGAFAAALEAASGGAPLKVTRPSTGFAPIATTVTAKRTAGQRAEVTAPTAPIPPTTSTPVLASVQNAPSKQKTSLAWWVAAGVAALGLAGALTFAFTRRGGGDEEATVGAGSPLESQVVIEAEAPTTEAHAVARTLTITSEPTGAEVEVDGAMIGNAPVSVPMPTEATYEVEVSAHGYESQTLEVGPDFEGEEARFVLDEAAEEEITPTMRSQMRRRSQTEVDNPWAREAVDPWQD